MKYVCPCGHVLELNTLMEKHELPFVDSLVTDWRRDHDPHNSGGEAGVREFRVPIPPDNSGAIGINHPVVTTISKDVATTLTLSSIAT